MADPQPRRAGAREELTRLSTRSGQVVVAGASPRSVELADVHLMHAGIADLPDLIVLARAAVRTARRNLAWACSYNGVGLWLAATGRLTPILAALFMVLSSVAVVLSPDYS